MLYLYLILYPTFTDASTAAAPALQALPKLGEVITATAETAIILAACHSLVVVEDADASAPAAAGPSGADSNNVSAAEKAAMAASAANANLVGDPIELAAIKGAHYFFCNFNFFSRSFERSRRINWLFARYWLLFPVIFCSLIIFKRTNHSFRFSLLSFPNTGIDWSWDAATSTASPTGGVHRCTMALALAQQQLKQLQVRFCRCCG